MTRVVYAFGDFRLDPERRTVHRGGTILPLSQKVFDVLLTLVEARGELVSRDALAERVWGQPVGDGTLSQHVFLLRQALRTDGPERQYVMTVQRKGYRFLEHVQIESPQRQGDRFENASALAHFLIAERHVPLQHYSEGSFMVLRRSESDLRAAIESFEAAIAADPYYVDAHAGLAVAHCMRGIYLFSAPGPAFASARRSAVRALELDRTSAEAHAVLGEVHIFTERDWESAFRELELAVQLNPRATIPSHQLACALLWSGQTERALAEIQRALEFSPDSFLLRAAFAYFLLFAGESNHAIALLERVCEQGPDWSLAAYSLAVAHLVADQPRAAISVLAPRQHADLGQQGLALVAHAYGAVGDDEAALEIVAELRRLADRQYVSEYVFATAYAGMGRTSDALDALDRLIEENGAGLALAKTFPAFWKLHGEPRFQAFLRRIEYPSHEEDNTAAS